MPRTKEGTNHAKPAACSQTAVFRALQKNAVHELVRPPQGQRPPARGRPCQSLEGLARAWKAKAFRRTPDAEEAISLGRDGEDLIAFGDAFITYAVGARQGFWPLAAGLGLAAPRDAVRAMTLMYAIENGDPEWIGDWLEESVARFLFPASGLLEKPREGSGDPGPAARLLEAAGQPGLLPRFLKAFREQAEEIYLPEDEIAFIDSKALDVEEMWMPLFFDAPLPSRWLFAVQKHTGSPLELVEIRKRESFPEPPDLGEDEASFGGDIDGIDLDEDDDENETSFGGGDIDGVDIHGHEDENEDEASFGDGDSGGIDIDEDENENEDEAWPSRRHGADFDKGCLGQALGVFAEAGIKPASCLLGLRLVNDPSLDACYDSEGRLTVPYLVQVRKDDACLQDLLAERSKPAFKRPERLSFIQNMRVFTITRPVKAGAGGHPAWLHLGLVCGTATREQQAMALERLPSGFCTEAECLAWEEERCFGIATGQEMSGEAAFEEYFALVKAAEVCKQAPCRRRALAGASQAQIRGQELFCAMGLALWGVMENSMRSSNDPHLPSLMTTLRLGLRCRIRPRWISLAADWEDDDILTAFGSAGLACPRTIFLEGRRLRYDPLRDFAESTDGWVDPDPEFAEYLASLTPEDMHADLMDRPFWPRRHRPAHIGRPHARPLPRLAAGSRRRPGQAGTASRGGRS